MDMNQLKEHIENVTLRQIQTFVHNDFFVFNSLKAHEPTVSVEFGRKYAKLITTCKYTQSRSCLGFIVLKEDKKFSVGDVLKCSSWISPATNFARGNIFEENSLKNCVTWTGIR